jgi:hypothetical protein
MDTTTTNPTLVREFWIPEGREPMNLGGGGADATIYIWDDEINGESRFHALAFQGNRAKPSLRAYYLKEESRSLDLADFLDRRRCQISRKAARKVAA